MSINFFRATMSLLALASTQAVVAHTRFQVSTVDENSSRHATYETEANIAHGCNGNAVIGNVILFPDQQDSILEVDGEVSDNQISDHIASGGFIRGILNRDVFSDSELISDSLGNPVGLYSYGGTGVPGKNWVGKVRFRVTGVAFQETSCAKSITFSTAIADVCSVTKKDGFNNDNVNLWTPAVGSNFDGPDLQGFDSPAIFKVERTSTLPESCGEGLEVVIKPSAAQINRDLPVVVDGEQIWPLP